MVHQVSKLIQYMWTRRTEAKENSPCETQYPSTKLLFSYLLPLYSFQEFSRVAKISTRSVQKALGTMEQHLFSLKFEWSNSFSSLQYLVPSPLNAGTSPAQKDNKYYIPPCYFTIRKHAFFSSSKHTGIISICLASLFWRWFTSFNYFSLSSSKHIWMPRTLIKWLCGKRWLNSPKPGRTSVD